ncbi:NAM-associated domain-containing protein [Caenorhabditis elegans]|uniref:NAM-associated domain-containing protein n=1 Tax=Caenorhabditis elegans TaxID=6239 RepID=B3WFW4_CAEEL|nr:NAM-associated domain-containing protein [Caenorhabditis elegans]CAQ76466.1 NAM-associated domain-containing protein [Caenorhabditis elegans]|eukprot:NP_001129762.1 Uncharacterized protein CELE_D2005.7 [Caenorhabditis elegans]
MGNKKNKSSGSRKNHSQHYSQPTMTVEECLKEYENTGNFAKFYPNYIFQRLPKEFLQKYLASKKNKNISKNPSLSCSNSTLDNMKETSKSIYVDVDPDDPLSDEAFTAQHPVEEWFRLPLEWRIEIERQRFVKKERADRAAEAARNSAELLKPDA